MSRNRYGVTHYYNQNLIKPEWEGQVKKKLYGNNKLLLLGKLILKLIF